MRMLNSDSRSRSAVGRIALRLRRRKRAPAQPSADDAHQRVLSGRAAGRVRAAVSRSSNDGRAPSPRRGRWNLFFSGDGLSRFGFALGTLALRLRGERGGPRLRLRLRVRQIGPEKSAPASFAMPLAELLAQDARRHFLDLALGKLAELERPERHADQPRSPAARDGAARCAPRGSCPRGSRR